MKGRWEGGEGRFEGLCSPVCNSILQPKLDPIFSFYQIFNLKLQPIFAVKLDREVVVTIPFSGLLESSTRC